MNKKRFLEELSRQLKHLPAEDRIDAIQYYEEYLEEMGLGEDADVVAVLGTPKEMAREIIGSCTEKHLEEHKENAGVKNSATLIWLVILGICASPIAIPLVIVAVVVIAVVVLTVGILVLSLVLTGIAVVFAGICSLLAAFAAGGIFQKMICVGAALICISLGVLFVFAIVKLAQLCVRLIVRMFRVK